ncbi:hypothetical protein SK128_001519 [Halocaridina rubra]|uniref:Uncharacterized protein n=1 Tax=Halocaridina rubra TaxID=373956 RepID=A0AAN9FX47_HALRR
MCYKCEGDDFCKITIRCSGSCAKKYDIEEEDDLKRYCSPVEKRDGSVQHLPDDDENVRTYFCNEDLCNGAPSTNTVKTLVTVLALAVVWTMA